MNAANSLLRGIKRYGAQALLTLENRLPNCNRHGRTGRMRCIRLPGSDPAHLTRKEATILVPVLRMPLFASSPLLISLSKASGNMSGDERPVVPSEIETPPEGVIERILFS